MSNESGGDPPVTPRRRGRPRRAVTPQQAAQDLLVGLVAYRLTWWGLPQTAETFEAVAQAAHEELGRAGHGDRPLSAERVEQLMEAYRGQCLPKHGPGRYTAASRRTEAPKANALDVARELLREGTLDSPKPRGAIAGEWRGSLLGDLEPEWQKFYIPGDLEMTSKARAEHDAASARGPRIGGWRLADPEPDEGEKG